MNPADQKKADKMISRIVDIKKELAKLGNYHAETWLEGANDLFLKHAKELSDVKSYLESCETDLRLEKKRLGKDSRDISVKTNEDGNTIIKIGDNNSKETKEVKTMGQKNISVKADEDGKTTIEVGNDAQKCPVCGESEIAPLVYKNSEGKTVKECRICSHRWKEGGDRVDSDAYQDIVSGIKSLLSKYDTLLKKGVDTEAGMTEKRKQMTRLADEIIRLAQGLKKS